jgi:hypothetical protein
VARREVEVPHYVVLRYIRVLQGPSEQNPTLPKRMLMGLKRTVLG